MSLPPYCSKCWSTAKVKMTVTLESIDRDKPWSDTAERLYCMRHNPDPLAAEFMEVTEEV